MADSNVQGVPMTFGIWVSVDSLKEVLTRADSCYFCFAGFISDDEVLLFVRDEMAAKQMFGFDYEPIPS